MKVLQLLDELEELAESSTTFPLTGKILVDPGDVLEIIKEIRTELPEELQRAKWINEERQRLLSEAENERDVMLADARAQAEAMIERDDITKKAKLRAEEIISAAEIQSKNLKMQTFEYLDNIMNSMQERMDYASRVYLGDMYQNMQTAFSKIAETLTDNRNEMKELAYKASIGGRQDMIEENYDDEE